MSSQLKNLSDYAEISVPSAEKLHFGIIVSEWNREVTNNLLDGAQETLLKHGAKAKNIVVSYVPGSFELPMGAQMIKQNHTEIDAVICLGCIIQGETRHFEFIASAVAHGICHVGLQMKIPVIFGVLTTNTLEQAKDRCGGKHGNKGTEAAITAIKMTALNSKKP